MINPPDSGSPCTPPRGTLQEQPRLSTTLTNTLELALPGVNAQALIHALDVLLGMRDNYTVVGSVSLHLQATMHPNPLCKLPTANDIDVVADETGILASSRVSPDTLKQIGLRKDPEFSQIFYMARGKHPELKIDLVSAATPGFRKYRTRPLSIGNVNSARVSDTLDDYKIRIKDPSFIQQCGDAKKAEEKIEPWLKYFDALNDSQQESQTANAEKRKRISMSPEDPGMRRVAKRLNFG